MGGGLYLYGVADSPAAVRLGPMGVDGCDVYTVPYDGFCVIVHDCPAEPYHSGDEGVVTGWVRAHQRVLDEAKRRLGTVIPAGFDTILRLPEGVAEPRETAAAWLRDECGRLQAVMSRIRGRDEYAVQIFYTPGEDSGPVDELHQEISKIREEIARRSPGIAYLYRQKLQTALKAEVERLAERWCHDFYARVRRHCDDVVIGGVRKAGGGRVMLLNLSCLVAAARVDDLGAELDTIDGVDGFSVHFSGPWPPYSFVGRHAGQEEMNGSGAGYPGNAGRPPGQGAGQGSPA